MRQHGRTLQRKWLALFYIGLNPRFDEFVAPTPISLRVRQPRLYKPRSPLAERNRERDHSARMALCIPDDYY
jgi:hypothetical protein